MSKLLIEEEPLVLLPSLAKALGNINEAIIVQQIHYWLTKKMHFHDGQYWTYNTYEDWGKQFPFMSERSIRRHIKRLENIGILVSSSYNKSKYDKTKWYTINYKTLGSFQPNGTDDEDNLDATLGHNLDTSINTENNTETNNICVSRQKELMTESMFNTFWLNYPSKKSKKRAREKFLRLPKDLFPTIMSALESHKKTEQWRKNIIPHAVTWLNQERWEDEIDNGRVIDL